MIDEDEAEESLTSLDAYLFADEPQVVEDGVVDKAIADEDAASSAFTMADAFATLGRLF